MSSFNITASPFNFWTHLKFTDSKFYIAPLAVESVCSEGNNEIIITNNSSSSNNNNSNNTNNSNNVTVSDTVV